MWEGVCFRGSLNIVIPILSVGPSRCGFVSKRMYKYRQYFLLRDASLLWQRVWMSHAGIVSKRLEISSNFFLGLVALPLWFSNTALLLRNSNEKGRLSLGWTLRPADTFTPSAYDTAVRQRSTRRYFSSLRMISCRAGFLSIS